MSLYLVSVWLHLLAAIAWIGGMLFMSLVLIPVMRQRGDSQLAASLIGPVGRRFRSMSWLLLAVLVLTGLVNASYRGVALSSYVDPQFWAGRFGSLLAVKLLVFVAMLGLSVAHDFFIGPRARTVAAGESNPSEAEVYRRWATRLGRLNLALGLIIVAIAVALARP